MIQFMSKSTEFKIKSQHKTEKARPTLLLRTAINTLFTCRFKVCILWIWTTGTVSIFTESSK